MRIVILTYESHQANFITQQVITQFPGQVAGIVRSEVIVAGKDTWQSLRFLLKKTGLGFVLPKGMEIILSRLAGLYLRIIGKKAHVPSLDVMCATHNIPLMGAKKVNTASTLTTLQSWQPDLVVSIYFNQLIKAKIINMAPQGVINLHPALLPKNRGLFPYFWALANGDEESGATVHWVDTKFDTGDLLLQKSIPITPQETVISLANKSAEVGANLLVEAISLIEVGQAPHLNQNTTEATYFSWPTPQAVQHFKQRGRKYGDLLSMWKEFVK